MSPSRAVGGSATAAAANLWARVMSPCTRKFRTGLGLGPAVRSFRVESRAKELGFHDRSSFASAN